MPDPISHHTTEARTALDALGRLEALREERALAELTGLVHDADYLADLDEDIAAGEHAYVGLAVTEIATLRAELSGPLVG